MLVAGVDSSTRSTKVVLCRAVDGAVVGANLRDLEWLYLVADLGHVVADAAYHGPALRALPENVTWTCRIPRNAVGYDLAPPRTGRRGRPGPRVPAWALPMTSRPRRPPGTPLPSPPAAASTSSTSPPSPACGTDHGTPGRAPDPGPRRAHHQRYDLALVSTDLTAAPAALVARYAARWAIEQAFADARNVPGVGEARNRVKLAVERTVPFGMLVHTLIVIWYTRSPAGKT